MPHSCQTKNKQPQRIIKTQPHRRDTLLSKNLAPALRWHETGLSLTKGSTAQISHTEATMLAIADKRRTIRIKRSSLLQCKLDSLDRPAIKIAETPDEYTRAFRLVYEEYLRSGYTKPHPSLMHYTIWSMLPQTSVFVFKSYHEVLCTLSHIPDSDMFGLPMDSLYKPEVDKLREKGRSIVEVGALATQYTRRWTNLMVYLAKAMFQYSIMSHVDDIVITVNPKHVNFYTQIFLFKPFGEVRHYGSVNAPAVALRINLSETLDELKEKYDNTDDFDTNLFTFFVRMNSGETDTKDNPVKRDQPLDPYTAYHLLRQRPELLDQLAEEQRDFIETIYHRALFNHFSTHPAHPETPSGVPLDMLKLENRDAYTDVAFCRNLGLVDYAGQRKLLGSRVAIAGLGGVGGVHLMTLARTGIGNFNLADFDAYSPVNINRQYGASIASFGRNKLDVMTERALSVNPFMDIRAFPGGITATSLDDFLKDVDLVVDGIDFFALDVRRQLFNRALALGIPVITAAPLGFSCALLVFTPGGMNFDDYFDITEHTEKMEAYLRFGMGLAPRPAHLGYMDRRFVSLHDRRGPSLDIACHMCAGMAATEAVRLLLGKKGIRPTPYFRQFDPLTGRFTTGKLRQGLRSPLQRLKLAIARRFFLGTPRTGALRPPDPEMVGLRQDIPPATLEYIAQAATRAPSGDNVQPWRIAMHETGIHIHAARQADDSFFNYRQIATLLACGAAAQNAVFAAGSVGLDADLSLFPDEQEHDRVASLHCTPIGVQSHEIMAAALWRRHTNRRMYSASPIPPAVRDRVDHIVGEQQDAALAWATAPAQRKTLAKAVYLADRVRVERPDLHEHLMRFIRFEPQKGPYGDGLPLGNLEAGLLGEMYLRGLRPWSAMHVANLIGLGRLMPLHGALSVLRSGGVALLLANGNAEADIVRAGMAWQRAWCALEHMGYSVQPLAALPLLHLRIRLGDAETLSPSHVSLLEKAWNLLAEALPHPSDKLPVMLFRTGIGSAIRHGTYRLPLSEILIPDDPA